LPINEKEYCEIVDEKLLPETLQALYSKSRLLIGMRFHSLIFALNVGTPVVGIYYHHIGPKISGLMKDFGWPNLEFDLKNMKVENFIKEMDKVINNKIELKIENKVNIRKEKFISTVENNLKKL